MNNLSALLKKYNCIDVHIGIIGSVTLSVTGVYDGEEIAEKQVPFSDFVYIDDFPLLMDSLNDFAASARTRMYAHFRMRFENELHWAYLSCRKSGGDGLDGVLLDVYEYLDCMPDDNVISEFEHRQSTKISVLNNNTASLEEICGREYLIKIQKPFLKEKGMYSVIFDEKGHVICDMNGEQTAAPKEYAFSAAEEIKFNFKTGGRWRIYSDNREQLERAAAYLKSLAENLSRIAHSFIALYNEAENSRAINKQLGANVEEQMLLNSMQSVIMEEAKAENALKRVLDMAGRYLKIDIILGLNIDKKTGVSLEACLWENPEADCCNAAQYVTDNSLRILSDFGNMEHYFSCEDDENSIQGASAFAVSKVIDNSGGSGIIFYGMCSETRRWSYNDRKIIRSVSQVLSNIIFRCRTERRIEEKNRQLYEMAYYDSMLGIKNRTRLDLDVAKALESKQSGVAMAVQILNTRFLNEVFGQNYTDRLLKLATQFLSSPEIGGKGVYRYSGSIMMLIIPDCSAENAQLITHRIISRFTKPFNIDGVEQYAETAVGIATYNDSTASGEDLYRAATLSLYRANEYGKNTFAFYGREFRNTSGDKFRIESELRRCIADGMRNFQVMFQPVISREGEIHHYETLLRWKSESMGLVSPKMFMRLMEKVGLDASIDFWVLPKACEFCKHIRETTGKDIKVSVNLTTHEMQTGALPAKIQQTLSEIGLEPEALIVEVPEAAHVIAYSDTASTLGKLKRLGVNICIDSFGSEYLTLNVLKNSYLDMIKISSSFVTNTGEEFDSVILKTALSLAENRGITVCVKNIEHKAQLEAAESSGAELMQGGFIAAPALSIDVEKSLSVKVR